MLKSHVGTIYLEFAAHCAIAAPIYGGGATLIKTIEEPGVSGPSIGFNPAFTKALNTDAETGLPWSYCTIKPVCPFMMKLPCPTATWTPETEANVSPSAVANGSDDDSDNTATSGATGSAAAPIKVVRRRHAERGASR